MNWVLQFYIIRNEENHFYMIKLIGYMRLQYQLPKCFCFIKLLIRLWSHRNWDFNLYLYYILKIWESCLSRYSLDVLWTLQDNSFVGTKTLKKISELKTIIGYSALHCICMTKSNMYTIVFIRYRFILWSSASDTWSVYLYSIE